MPQIPRRGELSEDAKAWEERLNADEAGAQSCAEDFTQAFMKQLMASETTTVVTTQEIIPKQDEPGRMAPPALPPKTKIMFSPSR